MYQGAAVEAAHNFYEAMTHSQTTELVSIVMRTVGNRPREIRRAIASIANNTWRPLEVIVVYQGPDNSNWLDLQKLPCEFPSLTLNVLINNAVGDRRAQNLNIGWNRALGRYIGFLDDDDTLAPNHIALLIDSMQATGKAWSYAQVNLRRENEALEIVSESQPFPGRIFSLKSLWTENFLPIHSFLIDRKALHSSLQQAPFHEELDRSEDWDFLLHLAFYHEPAIVDEFTATYHVSNGDRNTNLSLMDISGKEETHEQPNLEAWNRCKCIVEGRKAELAKKIWWSSEYLDIPPHTDALQSGTLPISQSRSLRDRVIRKLIRILERAL